MLKLSTLHTYLSQVLDLPDLHTAILLTPAGQLVCYASDSTRSKEDVRVAVGITGGSFVEVEEHGYAILEAEGKPHLGRIYVQAINELPDGKNNVAAEGWQPLMIVALAFTHGYDEASVQAKARAFADHLAKALHKHRDYLTAPKPPPSSISSPTTVR
ncbi:hypothetical protein BDP27DRAFT_1443959 [Rhodocollybia butyracea]|uniref:Uncharacterized protein n=1 Tax=Rhodocollybia butyracea TaxID=206335 RepID=A0A9P5Q6K8_9AGAR|nr:hypothetical protein BDP27DRAFT_1443959 [Rhodocollybia butyracea]